jgi:hypothetical protein
MSNQTNHYITVDVRFHGFISPFEIIPFSELDPRRTLREISAKSIDSNTHRVYY